MDVWMDVWVIVRQVEVGCIADGVRQVANFPVQLPVGSASSGTVRTHMRQQSLDACRRRSASSAGRAYRYGTDPAEKIGGY